jgi:beta-lactam-binding protein with PASTA domain
VARRNFQVERHVRLHVMNRPLLCLFLLLAFCACGKEVTVPNVIGLKLSQATTALEDKGLLAVEKGYVDGRACGKDMRPSNFDRTSQRVIKELPTSGSHVSPKTKIGLWVEC